MTGTSLKSIFWRQKILSRWTASKDAGDWGECSSIPLDCSVSEEWWLSPVISSSIAKFDVVLRVVAIAWCEGFIFWLINKFMDLTSVDMLKYCDSLIDKF